MKARVKPGNSYGGLTAGAIVDVDEGECRRVPWCLEPVVESVAPAAEPARAKAPPMAPPPPVADLPPTLSGAEGESAVAGDLAAQGQPDPHAAETWEEDAADETADGSKGRKPPAKKKK